MSVMLNRKCQTVTTKQLLGAPAHWPRKSLALATQQVTGILAVVLWEGSLLRGKQPELDEHTSGLQVQSSDNRKQVKLWPKKPCIVKIKPIPQGIAHIKTTYKSGEATKLM
jgi:hypothetical protein